jgi:dienelactone hydrolase
MRASIALLLVSCARPIVAQDLLPGSVRWVFPADIVAEQYAGQRAFYERQIAEAARSRAPIRSESDRAAARADLRRMIGAVDTLLAPKPEFTPLSTAGVIRASLVQWPVSRIGTLGPTMGSAATQVRLYGLLLEPPGARRPAVVAIPDAGESAATAKLPWQLARDGFVVFAPFFTQRRAFSQPWLEDRQWLVRLAYQTGRHLTGSEVLQALAVRDWLAARENVDSARIAVAGSGQGGMTALFAGALDERFAAVASAGYLTDERPDWDQPEDRILWKFRARFTNGDLRAMVAPRALLEDVSGLGKLLKAEPVPESAAPPALDPETVSRIAHHQFSQWQSFYRNMALESARKRAARWRPDYSSVEAYHRSLAAKREAYFDMIGRYPEAAGPLHARSVQVYDKPGFRGYRLSVRVYDGVDAYGILLEPKGLKAGERRPVVFVQHGLAGIPEHSLGVEPNERADAVYSRFGLRLVERGYIVFAPMIATQDNIERTKLVRRSHLAGMIPVGMDVRKFGRVIDYLSTLPHVDTSRFAFYGLSYGGYTALWASPGEPRFRVVVSSGHFNDWVVKTTDITLGTAYPHYPNVFDQYNFGMLNEFNHSDLASLIAPRPLLIEMGDFDGVIVEPRALADAEIGRVLDIYRRLGIPEKGACARFPGPHKIDGAEAYAFLDRWLAWKPIPLDLTQ